MRVAAALFVVFVPLFPLWASGQGQSSSRRIVTVPACLSDLGVGMTTRRTFCDVTTAETTGPSITIEVPPHEGEATLSFDLHNRFSTMSAGSATAPSYVRHQAVVRIVDQNGQVIDRAAVVREFRSEADLFDRLAGGGRPDGSKGIAPGRPEAIRVTIPRGTDAVGIVGESLDVRGPDGRDERFDAPGRPVAVASNIRLEYTPR